MQPALLLALRSLLGAALLVPPCLAQYQFNTPAPEKQDFSETFFAGDTLGIEWAQGWSGVGPELDSADLFVTWAKSDDFYQLLRSNLTLDAAGTMEWKIDINDTILATDNRFVLRFKQHYNPTRYTASQNQSPSRQFYIKRSTLKAASSSSFTTSATPSLSPTSIPTSTSEPPLNNKDVGTTSASTEEIADSSISDEEKSPSNYHRRNTSAIVGASVGAGAFVALAVGIGAWWYLRRDRRKRERRRHLPHHNSHHGPHGNPYMSRAQDPTAMPYYTMEKGQFTPIEAMESRASNPVEMDAMSKPVEADSINRHGPANAVAYK